MWLSVILWLSPTHILAQNGSAKATAETIKSFRCHLHFLTILAKLPTTADSAKSIHMYTYVYVNSHVCMSTLELPNGQLNA